MGRLTIMVILPILAAIAPVWSESAKMAPLTLERFSRQNSPVNCYGGLCNRFCQGLAAQNRIPPWAMTASCAYRDIPSAFRFEARCSCRTRSRTTYYTYDPGIRAKPASDANTNPARNPLPPGEAEVNLASGRANKTIRQSLVDVALSTKIHGVSSVFNRERHIVERVLWGLVILASLGLSLNDGILFFKCYMSEPTQTEAYISHNQSIHIMKPTLCIRLREDAYLSWINISDPMIVRDYLKNVSITKYDLRRLAEPEFGDLLVMTALMLQDVARMENYKPNATTETDLDITFQTQRWERSDILDVKDSPSTVQTYLFYHQLGVDFAKLVGWAGEAICKRLEISFTNAVRANVTKKSRFDVCKRSLVSWFGRLALEVDVVPADYVCYELNRERISFYTPSDYGHVQLNYLNLFDEKRAFKRTTFIGVIDLHGRLIAVDMGDNTIPIWHGLSKNYYLRLNGHFRSLNLTRRHCVPFGDRVECASTERALQRRKVCGCWPLSWFAFYERGEFGDVDRLCTTFALSPKNETDTDFYGLLSEAMGNRCNTSTFVEAPKDAIEAECSQPCNTLIFSTTEIGAFESPVSNISSADGRSTTLTIRMLDFSYPVFEEKLVYDGWRYFVSSIGGTVGFWLGASVLAVVSFLMSILRLILGVAFGDIHGRKRSSEASSGGQTESKNLHAVSLVELAAQVKSLRQKLRELQEEGRTANATDDV